MPITTGARGYRETRPVTEDSATPPGAARVHFKLEFDWKQTPLYNVIATLKGATNPLSGNIVHSRFE